MFYDAVVNGRRQNENILTPITFHLNILLYIEIDSSNTRSYYNRTALKVTIQNNESNNNYI